MKEIISNIKELGFNVIRQDETKYYFGIQVEDNDFLGLPTYIGFFLEGDNGGKVYIWYHDMGEEDELEFLADSFDDFMKGLSNDD